MVGSLDNDNSIDLMKNIGFSKLKLGMIKFRKGREIQTVLLYKCIFLFPMETKLLNLLFPPW